MRKHMWKFAVLLPLFVFFMLGCEGEPSGPIDPPGNLTISIGSDGLTITLNWTKSPTEDTEDGIDGYKVYFKPTGRSDSLIGTIDVNQSGAYTKVVGDVGRLGTFSVVAYRDEDESPAVEISTELYAPTQTYHLALWTSPDPSAIGWNRTNGHATLYNATDTNVPSIDLVYDSNNNTLNSPDVLWSSGRANGIVNTGTTNLADYAIAPQSGGYYNFEEVVGGQVYAMYVVDGTDKYYLKLKVESVTSTGIDISYAFQKIANYRRLK